MDLDFPLGKMFTAVSKTFHLIPMEPQMQQCGWSPSRGICESKPR